MDILSASRHGAMWPTMLGIGIFAVSQAVIVIAVVIGLSRSGRRWP